MNWAGKLFDIKDEVPNVPKTEPYGYMLGYNKALENLVLAVLEKNKEIARLSSIYEWRKAQARAFRELAEACEK